MSKLGDWIKAKYKSQAAFAEELGVQQSRVSKWLSGSEAIPEDFRDKIEGMKYKGPWPREEAKDAAAGGPAPYVTREEYGALDARLKAVEKSLEETRNALIGATGAIRLLATKAGLHEILELLK